MSGSFRRRCANWSPADTASKSRNGQVRALIFADEDYVAAGAQIVGTAERIFKRAELIVQVKEPLAAERRQLHGG